VEVMRHVLFSRVKIAFIGLVFGASSVVSQEVSLRDAGYRIGPGDVLEVKAFQYDEISGTFPVEATGTLTFPLLGNVEVADLDTIGVSKLLEELLEKDFYVDVQLQVEVKEFRSKPVTVLGEVVRPGTYYLKGQTTLAQILTEAGGLKPTAGPSVELRRQVIGEFQNEQNEAPEYEVRSFSMARIMTAEEGVDVALQAGDVVSVSARQLFFVTGEVSRPGQYEISEGLTLMQAISQAGGLGKFASQRVELHRDQAGEKAILEFDLARIRKGKDEDPNVQPGDVVIVRRRFF
jgi:polysaccharide export outer membrane protein